MPEDVVRERTAELLDVLDLAHAGRTLIADYSTGMRKKIGLASALLHGPSVLVLDEPFEAVDPVSAAGCAPSWPLPGRGRDGRDEHARDGAGRAALRSRRRSWRTGGSCGPGRCLRCAADRHSRPRSPSWSARHQREGCHGSRPDRAAPHHRQTSAARTNPAALPGGRAGSVFISALAPSGWGWCDIRIRRPLPTCWRCCSRSGWAAGSRKAALAGDAVLRPEVFGLLPAGTRRLAFSLLAVGMLDPAGPFTAVAFAALIARGARLGIVPAAVGLAAVILTLALASVLSTVAGAALGPGSRRGHDTGTIVTAVAISAIAVAATLLPALDTALRRGSVPWLATGLRLFPTGWGPVAVEAAARSDWLVAGRIPGGPGRFDRGCRRLVAGRPDQADGRRGAPRAGGCLAPGPTAGPLPRTPAGAVTAKEIRMWVRTRSG